MADDKRTLREIIEDRHKKRHKSIAELRQEIKDVQEEIAAKKTDSGLLGEMFDYIAHIQTGDGKTMELAGSMRAYETRQVYTFLTTRASELKGFLITSKITDRAGAVTTDTPFRGDTAEHTPKLLPVVGAKVVDVPAIFSDREVFGVFTGGYKGAASITYKATKE